MIGFTSFAQDPCAAKPQRFDRIKMNCLDNSTDLNDSIVVVGSTGIQKLMRRSVLLTGLNLSQTLQEVTDLDNHLTDRDVLMRNTADSEFKADISSYYIKYFDTSGDEYTKQLSTGFDYGNTAFKTALRFFTPTANNTITFQDGTGTVAFVSDLSGYVPYSGATTDLNMGYHDVNGRKSLMVNGGEGAYLSEINSGDDSGIFSANADQIIASYNFSVDVYKYANEHIICDITNGELDLFMGSNSFALTNDGIYTSTGNVSTSQDNSLVVTTFGSGVVNYSFGQRSIAGTMNIAFPTNKTAGSYTVAMTSDIPTPTPQDLQGVTTIGNTTTNKIEINNTSFDALKIWDPALNTDCIIARNNIYLRTASACYTGLDTTTATDPYLIFGTGSKSAKLRINASQPSTNIDLSLPTTSGTIALTSALTGGTVTSIPDGTTNGVTWSVATRTTTPTFSFSLGSITPTAVNVSGATASTVAEFDGSKNLISATKGTAYNKSFGTGTTNVPEIGATLGNSQIVETDASGKLITAAKGTAYNKSFGTGTTNIPEIGTTLVASRGLTTDAGGKLKSNATSAVQRWQSGADGTSVSATTTPTITYSQLIPGGTFVTGDVPRIFARATSNAAKTATTDFTIYVNTSNSLSGATQIGQVATGSTTRTAIIERHLAIKGATTKVVTATSSAAFEGTPTGAESTLTIDWTVDQYIMEGITHSVALDEMHGDCFKIIN